MAKGLAAGPVAAPHAVAAGGRGAVAGDVEADSRPLSAERTCRTPCRASRGSPRMRSWRVSPAAAPYCRERPSRSGRLRVADRAASTIRSCAGISRAPLEAEQAPGVVRAAKQRAVDPAGRIGRRGGARGEREASEGTSERARHVGAVFAVGVMGERSGGRRPYGISTRRGDCPRRIPGAGRPLPE